MSRMKPISSPARPEKGNGKAEKKNAGARRRHRMGRAARRSQRSDVSVTGPDPAAELHDAGKWRGRDMAAAATSVASSNRRVHIVASSVRFDRPSG
jgi:hypothetical protein